MADKIPQKMTKYPEKDRRYFPRKLRNTINVKKKRMKVSVMYVFCMADSLLVVLTRIIKFKEKEEEKN